MLRRGRSFGLVSGPVIGVVAASFVLASCGGDDEPKELTGPKQDTGCGYSSGPYSDSVTVSGDFGAAVTASFDGPMKPPGLERTIVTQGKGKQTKDGSSVNASVSVFNGNNGELITQQSNKTTVGEAATPTVLAAGLRCVPIGSRVVATAPASTLFGDQGNEEAGLSADDGIIVVTDITEVLRPPKAEGWSDAPAVTFRGRRSPVLTVPSGPAPESVQLSVLKAGDGALVQAGDQVTVNFKTMIWGSGKVVVETYGKGKGPLKYGTNDFVPGFTSAILGQRGGAQLIVAIPPEFGYGAAGAESVGIGPDDTLLVVIEILATARPATP